MLEQSNESDTICKWTWKWVQLWNTIWQNVSKGLVHILWHSNFQLLGNISGCQLISLQKSIHLSIMFNKKKCEPHKYPTIKSVWIKFVLNSMRSLNEKDIFMIKDEINVWFQIVYMSRSQLPNRYKTKHQKVNSIDTVFQDFGVIVFLL